MSIPNDLDRNYVKIARHYESCFAKHGDTHLGVDWPRAEHVPVRHQVMLDIIRPRQEPVLLLDFGCGSSQFYQFLKEQPGNSVEYSGLDISPIFVDFCKNKFPENRYYCLDILDNDSEVLPVFDYIIANGVFTVKRDLSFEDMFSFFREVVRALFAKTKIGLGFNVMSKNVDWEREDLFHLSLDQLTSFLCKDISRNIVIRNDYGLYEYTTYVYR